MNTTNTELEKSEKQTAQQVESCERLHGGPIFVPRTDIYESEDSVRVITEMPGVDENSVDINLENNTLKIYGKVAQQIPENMNLIYNEYAVGDYERSFTLSAAIDREAISAAVKDGVLSLTLPKAAEAKARKIEVKAG